MPQLNGIAWQENGSPENIPVIFIHAFPLHRAMWEPQVRALSGIGRIVTYDVRGFGESEAGPGYYTMEAFVDDLIRLMDYRGIRRAVWCGLSMGGYIALRAAEREPARCLGLILCDTKSAADGNEAKLGRAAAIRSVQAGGVERFAGEFVKKVLSAATLKNKPELVERVLAMIRAGTVPGICGSLLAMAGRTDTTTALPGMDLPALVLVGAEDRVTPPADAEALQKALPHAQMHVLAGAAHLSNLENPSAFNEKMLAFIREITARPL